MAVNIEIPLDLTDQLMLRETLLSIVAEIDKISNIQLPIVYTKEEVDTKISEAIDEVKKSLRF